MANPNFDTILATTLYNYRKTLEDNIFKANPFMYWLQRGDRFERQDGGAKIVEPLMGTVSTAVGSYSGYDTLAAGNSQSTDLTAAEFAWQQFYGTVAISGIEEAKNSGTTESRLGTTLGATGNMPKAYTIAIHKNRIFLGNCDSGTNKSRVRYSGSDTTPTDVEYYKSTSYIDVQQDDGDQIQKLIPFLDSLLIFKTSSTWVLRGNNPRDFELVLANPSVGCVAPRTVAAWDKGVIFLSARGVFSFDGSKVTRLSEKIDSALNDLPVANLSQSNGVVFQQKYYLFVHELGGTSYPDTAYVFDLISGTWTKYRGWNIWHATVWNRAGTEELYAVDAATREATLRLKSGTSDDGGAIDAYFTTKWLDFGVPERRKMHRRMYAWFEAAGDYDVNVDVQRNYAAANAVSNTVNLNPGGMIWGTSLWGESLWGAGQDIVRARLTGIGTSPAIRVKVHDISTNPWTFEGLAFVIQPRNLA